jgi:integrase
VITLHDSKNGDGRTVPLYGALGELVERRRTRRAPSPWVFHRRGQPVRDFREAWLAACKATQLAGKVFHDLRRTAIRDPVRAGVPDTVAMTISGHWSRSTFDRYNIASEKDRAEALPARRGLSRCLAGASRGYGHQAGSRSPNCCRSTLQGRIVDTAWRVSASSTA